MDKSKQKFKTRIRKGDLVQVISGQGAGQRRVKDGGDIKERGVRGKVLSIDLDKGTAIVQGVKMQFKHKRINRNDPTGSKVGRIEKEGPVSLSNLMLVDPKSDEVTRVGVRMEKHERDGGKVKTKRIRVAKVSGADISERS
jgi:large subunit ribosomal protein L24